MFPIPGLLDPPFVHLCLSLALAVFLLLDVIRAGQIPPASGWIARFLQPYVDGRDLKGPVVVSHVFLLVGTGIGWWLTFAAYEQNDWDWAGKPVDLGFISGVVCVGLGDTAASLVGRRIGKTKWGWRGGKSVEGSSAFVLAVTMGLSIARWWLVGIEGDWGWKAWIKLLTASTWGSMAEASITGVNDNVVVPVGVWMVVRALGL
jgi:dolichol kinase